MGTVKGISKSGTNAAALATNASKQIIDIGTNQAFQLTEVIVANANTTTAAIIRIFDEAAGAPTANLQKVPDIYVGPEETVKMTFADGPKFYTELAAEAEGSGGTVSEYMFQANGVMF